MTDSDRPRGPGRIRTSDAEREQIAQVLRAAMGEGRLTLVEGEERLAAAYAATYRDELPPLTADLPAQGREALARTPQARAETNRRLRWHGARLVAVAAVLTGLWVLSGAHFFWPAVPLMILTFVFLRRLRWARYGGGPGWYGPRGGWHHGARGTGG
ncbi:DUF1707 SHOCT-like domain-containing protein [Rhizomonospora bruguierae]|uniref:DUF1707 SHOCT-like domain-containing protein n=1 Tax=Rhizomonospora bruguierae TaxID=1581705 RepID=UPI001BCC89BE|nr:DUF1707 domain-containing protein [Micromonospora sp. NBRC 107566]